MNKNQKIRIAMIVCAVIVAAAVLASVSGMFGGNLGFTYANADRYTAGGAEITGTVRNLAVNWVDGSVTVAYHDQASILLSEKANRTLSEDAQLRWWLDGDTLRIQYAKPGFRLNFNLHKELTLTLPRNIALAEVNISTVSADVAIPALSASQLSVNTTSGDMRLALAEKAEKIALNTVSGDVQLEADEAAECRIASTSGRLSARIPTAGKVKLASVSGSVDLKTGKADEIDIGTTSGSVTLALPEAPGFTAEIGTVSGSVSTGLALTKNGNTYTAGNGGAPVHIATVSGDIRLDAWQE